MSKTRKLVFTALFIAMGIVLPIAFHLFPNGGRTFLPMHIPVLLCGLVAGPLSGLACGILTPLLSSAMTGMPPAAVLPGMTVELACYGMLSGLFMKSLPIQSRTGRIYASLILAMLIGRAIAGLFQAFIFQAGSYTLSLWLSGYFLTGLPGILLQLVLVPLIVRALEKSSLFPPN